jgi:glutamyl-tRNA synthetase
MTDAVPSATPLASGSRPVRVRFAPSPTGYFHVGGAKTSLYNWIYARQHRGKFVLRIEDTDAERNRPEWIDGIQRAMEWIHTDLDSYGPAWDEGPYFQSHNLERHVSAAHQLHQQGHAYYCNCTREQIDARNAAHRAATGEVRTGYDGFCRDRDNPPAPDAALRFRVHHDGITVVDDLIRGNPEFANATLEDFVILRANGSPMFILANVVDDIDMRISHVIRAEEHLPNTPKAQLLWTALDGGPLPTFAHVPLLVNEKRQKLSKRRDLVALEMYRDEGYLPEAMRNFLMTLGWAPQGDTEIVPWDVIMREFRLEAVHSSPAFFDVTKLRAFNGEYIRALSVVDFEQRAQPWLSEPLAPWTDEQFDTDVFHAMAPLVQERVKRLSEVPEHVDFLFLDDAPHDGQAWEKTMKGDAAALLDGVIARYETVDWNVDALMSAVAEVGEQFGIKAGKAQAPVRVAITGRTVGPPLFQALVLFGRERTLDRLRRARAKLD